MTSRYLNSVTCRPINTDWKLIYLSKPLRCPKKHCLSKHCERTLMFLHNKTICCTDVINGFSVRLSEVQGGRKKNCQRHWQSCRWHLRAKTAMNLLKRVNKNATNLRGGFFLLFYFIFSKTFRLFMFYRKWHPRDWGVRSVLKVTMTKRNALEC